MCKRLATVDGFCGSAGNVGRHVVKPHANTPQLHQLTHWALQCAVCEEEPTICYERGAPTVCRSPSCACYRREYATCVRSSSKKQIVSVDHSSKRSPNGHTKTPSNALSLTHHSAWQYFFDDAPTAVIDAVGNRHFSRLLVSNVGGLQFGMGIYRVCDHGTGRMSNLIELCSGEGPVSEQQVSEQK